MRAADGRVFGRIHGPPEFKVQLSLTVPLYFEGEATVIARTPESPGSPRKLTHKRGRFGARNCLWHAGEEAGFSSLIAPPDTRSKFIRIGNVSCVLTVSIQTISSGEIAQQLKGNP